MSGRSKKPKSRSGPTQTAAERRASGARRIVSFTLPPGSIALADRFAVAHGCSRSAIMVMALGALVHVEGEP